MKSRFTRCFSHEEHVDGCRWCEKRKAELAELDYWLRAGVEHENKYDRYERIAEERFER